MLSSGGNFKTMANEKWSEKLKEYAAAAGADSPLSVILELKKTIPEVLREGSPTQRMQQLRQSFEQQANQLKETIHSLGGEVTGEAWLNSTIAAKLPPKALHAMGREENVHHIDVPHPIERES